MTIFEIETDDGEIFEIEGPDDATDEELRAAISQSLGIQQTPPVAQQRPPLEKPQSIPSAAFEALGEPARVSQRGLSQLAGAVPQFIGGEPEPTGNLPLDIARGAPRIAAETLAETAPQFIDQLGILTAGAGAGIKAGARAAAPLARGAGRLAAKGIEKVVGVGADKVEKLFAKPLSILRAPTKGAVREAFSKAETAQAVKGLKEIVAEGVTTSGASIRLAGKQILKGQPNAKVILRGRKALDKQIATLESQLATAKGGRGALQETMESKFALRRTFNEALDKIAPKLRAADKVAAQQLDVDPFRRVALPGSINFFTPKGLARAIPGLPSILGASVAGAGGAAKAVNSLLNSSPQAKAAIVGVIQNLLKDKLNKGEPQPQP